jgi:hypothetical protein
MRKLTKAEMQEALHTLPDQAIFGASHTGLTGKQKAFARKVAMGKTKAQAYREAYKPDATKATILSAPYELANNPKVAREIEALELAERAAAYRTPAKLREFVIQTLLEVALDPETKAAVRVQAVKTLGTVTEVAAFTDRKEVRTISSSETARARVLEEIKSLMASTDDVVDVQAKSLMDELTSESNERSVNITKTQGQDTPAQYDDAQVVDSIRTACQDDDGSTGKDDKNTLSDGGFTGGGM